MIDYEIHRMDEYYLKEEHNQNAAGKISQVTED